MIAVCFKHASRCKTHSIGNLFGETTQALRGQPDLDEHRGSLDWETVVCESPEAISCTRFFALWHSSKMMRHSPSPSPSQLTICVSRLSAGNLSDRVCALVRRATGAATGAGSSPSSPPASHTHISGTVKWTFFTPCPCQFAVRALVRQTRNRWLASPL